MFRFLENLVDPYVKYDETDAPPKRLWPFMWDYSQPFKRVFFWAGLLSLIVAMVEIGLICYMGRVVDLLAQGGPKQVLSQHGTELLLLAGFILIIRPLFIAADVGVLNNAILPNFGALFRWRAHRHVLRQSVGWFENDFAGRIVNRIMQATSAAGEAVFQVFDAITYSAAYILGALILLGEADKRLMITLVL